jgi:hypothetical protein
VTRCHDKIAAVKREMGWRIVDPIV